MAARALEDESVEQAPSLEFSKHRLAAVAGTSTCHMVQVSPTRALRRSLPHESPSLKFGASGAKPIVCPRGMGSLQDSLVDVRSAITQAFVTVPFLSLNALFPDWWMNEGGQIATGEARFRHSRAHIVIHIRTPDSASLSSS